MESIERSHKEFLVLDKDYSQTARAADLIYVNDKSPGISRIKKEDNFLYEYDDKAVTDEKQLARIKKLAIPPAWTNVWISYKENGHIQATGLDVKNRKQYRYHTLWHTLRDETKFHRLYEFGRLLPNFTIEA